MWIAVTYVVYRNFLWVSDGVESASDMDDADSTSSGLEVTHTNPLAFGRRYVHQCYKEEVYDVAV